jgi:GntR family transcriptional regulator
MSLQKNHPIALYYQLAELLREQIEDGQLQIGERIPSVRALAAQHGISQVTVRQALGELIKQGLLDVRRGVGTFVASPKIAYDSLFLTGFSEDMLSRGLMTHAKLLHLAVETPTVHIAQQLAITKEEMVIRIVRQRYSNGEPVVLDQSYLPSELCPGLEKEDLGSKSLYALLEGRWHLKLAHSTQWLEATGANDYEAELFGLPAGAPVILVRGVTYLADERPVEYFKVVYRGDRFKFRLETSRPHK